MRIQDRDREVVMEGEREKIPLIRQSPHYASS